MREEVFIDRILAGGKLFCKKVFPLHPLSKKLPIYAVPAGTNVTREVPHTKHRKKQKSRIMEDKIWDSISLE